MGLGLAAIKLNLELWQRGIFNNINSVIDMGAQELHLKLEDFEELIQTANLPNYKREDFANLANWPGLPRCSSKPFYEMLGIKDYSCLDIAGKHDVIKMDLNFPLEEASLYGRYDMVTDHGNNEHVFNIAEAYRTMHRLCKRDGILVIIQPIYGGNGYYLYEPSFFEGMAAANNYKILFSSYVIMPKTQTEAGSPDQFHAPLSDKLLKTLDWSKLESIGISYVMQKKTEDDFRYPYQGYLLPRSQGHFGYHLQFLPTPPARTYVPLGTADALKATPTKSLGSLFFQRVGIKFKTIFKPK